MRIFVFEYITGGGMLGSELLPSLVREGDLMLRTLVSDLSELDEVEVTTIRDYRCAPLGPSIRCRYVYTPEQFLEVWHGSIEAADAVWPVAPERHGTLERICRAVSSAGKVLLNSGPSAVHMAASKTATARLLAIGNLPVVPTYGLEDPLPDLRGRWILKPDDGVGCLNVKVLQDTEALVRYWESLPDRSDYVAQPLVQGMAASLCLLACEGEAAVLSVNRQRIAVMDDALVLLGCVVNGLGEEGVQYRALGAQVAAVMPELWGFVGVDFIITPSGPTIVEINPRLTTSYVGLKESIGVNPAGLVLDLAGNGRAWCEYRPLVGKVVDVYLEHASVA